jgi:hypothetical protein
VTGGGGGTIVATSGRWVRTEGWGTRGQGGGLESKEEEGRSKLRSRKEKGRKSG